MASGQGVADGGGQTKLKDGEAAKTYGLLEASDARQVLHTAGTWEIRCCVISESESDILYSKPVEVKVIARTEIEKQALAKYAETRRGILHGKAITLMNQIETLTNHAEALSGSYTGTCVRRTVLLLKLKDAQDDKDRKAALQALHVFGKELSYIDREYLKLCIVGELIDRKEVDEAETLLAEISDDSDLEKSIRDRLQTLKKKMMK